MKNGGKIRFAVFALTFVLSCFTVSTDKIKGYFGYSSTDMLIFKYLIIFCCVLVATVINIKQIKKAVYLTAIFNCIFIFIFLFDYYVTRLSGSIDYYRMWWLSAFYIANAAFYCGLYLCFCDDFYRLSRVFWLGFTPAHFASSLIIFLRLDTSYFSLNTKPGNGLLGQMDYLISHFHGNSWPLFNLVGNVVFFIPAPFIIKAVFPRLKGYAVLIISLIIPFIIEGYQYIFKRGAVDIDDIITNTLGILTGFFISIIFKKIYDNIKQLQK